MGTAIDANTILAEAAVEGLPILAEQTISGSDATTIDFSGLDLTKSKTFFLKSEIINPIAVSLSSYNLFVNGDFTATNYQVQRFQAFGSSLSGSDLAQPTIGQNEGSVADDEVTIWSIIDRSALGHFTVLSQCLRHQSGGAAAVSQDWRVRSISPISNITTLRVKGDQVGSLGIGTKFILYGAKPNA